jgi:iron complex outermembrane receptor protein
MNNQIITNFKKSFVVFKQWKRKGYSVFNTLSKVIKITTIALSYSIVLVPLQVLSQTDTTVTKNLDLEEVVVSAQKSPVLYSQLSRMLTTVNDEEIKQLPVSSVDDLLENFSGVDIRQRGNGIQADISIRGGSFDQNLILLNGVNISDPQTGHHSLNLPLDLTAIERIEILEGPGSRVFGPNAFSGAINIITNQSDDNYTKAQFTAGDFGLFSGNVATSYKIGKTKHFLSFSKSNSKGYMKNTDFDQYNMFYNSNFSSDIGKVDFQLGYSNKEFGANSFYTPAYPDQFEEIKTTFTSLRFETGEKIKLIPVVYFRRHQDRFELFRYDPASWYTGHNYHLTDIYGIKIDSRISTKLGVTAFGAEIRSENIWSNVLGNVTGDTISAIGESDGFYTREYSRTISNYFLEHALEFGQFTMSAGVLASWVSENDFDFTLFPGFDLGYSINKRYRIYATVNKSLRLPTFTDLFYNGPSNIGNPDLKPEEAWSYELGIKYNTNMLESSISYFYRDATDVIEWVRPENATIDDKWKTQNLTHVETNGITFRGKLNLGKWSFNNITLSYAWLDQKASASIDAFETKYSSNHLKHNLILNLKQTLLSKVGVSWVLRYQDRAGNYLQYDKNTNSYIGEKDFDPYLLVDAKINYTWGICTIFSEISNLFNQNYTDIGNLEMPGRWFKAGFNVHIGY